ncbi:recombinase family protein, partial [bacterium]|nr:recombinase family protein [bacterium]
IDRWARNVTSGIMLLDELNEKRKIKIISTEGEYEYSNPNDCFIVRFFLLLAEQEQGQKMDRVFLKISKMMLSGEYPRKSVPLGYKRAKNNKLMPEVWCKKVINDIYDTFISIKNYSKTARDINKKYPKIFAGKLTGYRVEWIIRSKIYIGYLHWGGEFFGEGENNRPRKSLKVISKNKFDTAQHIADQIRRQYGRDTCSVIEDLVDKYGLEPVLDVMDLKAACPNCGWILKEKNGKEKTKDLFQRKYICKNCRTEFRFPLVRQIKKIEKLVSMPCRKCNAKANFTLLSDDSDFWQLKCDNCNHVILLHEFLGKSDSKNSSNEKKGNKGEEDRHDTIQTSFY